ncbi:aquaporin family protein [Alicyclobacillus tolerans]|uniref:MIP/aquaporin family protein n=1 Tax=Alicyclobacillus tolerans TaxID=90970 RepID=UPI001F2C92D2|nr:MIP/aquaporin family protein [Alicyclobacillus tolerans]MCF8564165.1 aquaporin family protein [Alicyclobacillus tolerans]
MASSVESRGWRSTTWGELLAEFISTAILLAFGDGVVAVAVVGLTMSGRTVVIFQGAGGWLLITWGWAFAVVMGAYLAGGVSGAHMNPAVTFALALKGDLPWKKVVPYWIAQVLGAFVGAALVYMDYHLAMNAWNAAHHITSRASAGGLTTFSIFATFPAPYFHGNWFGPFLDQVLGTFLLVLLVLAIGDAKNSGVQANLGPFIVGLAVAAIGMSFGVDAGYAINPARDFGPRLFAWLAGWGPNAFPGPGIGGYWWIPIVGPLVGGGIGPFVYKWFIADTIAARLGKSVPTLSEDSKVSL